MNAFKILQRAQTLGFLRRLFVHRKQVASMSVSCLLEEDDDGLQSSVIH